MRFHVSKTHEEHVACREACARKDSVVDSVRHGCRGGRYQYFGLSAATGALWIDGDVGLLWRWEMRAKQTKVMLVKLLKMGI
jgi:hypothetical protein